MINRAAIYAALWAHLNNIAGFATYERRLRHWSDVSGTEMPYLAMAQTNQSAQTVKGTPTIWTLGGDLWIYVRTDGNQVPADIMNPLLDAVEASIAPGTNATTQTLGGVVSHCWIEGEIQTDEGTLGDIAVARVPIRIKAT